MIHRKEDVMQKILDEKAIAIVRGYTEEQCLELAKALSRGGINLMEVTFPQTNAAEQAETARVIRRLIAELGDRMCFGAGTVTTPELVDLAYEAGCTYIISPDTDEDVIRRTVELGLVSIPGALTPTEIKKAAKLGADFVKVFPASSMGPAYFKDVHAPLPGIRMLAVGGANTQNGPEYLKAGAVGVGVAGCLFNKSLIADGAWDKITENAKALRAALN